MADSVLENNGTPNCLGKLRRSMTRATKGTVVSSFFILLSSSVGAGTLSLPYAFAKGGIFVFSIIFFIIMLMAVYVGIMLLHSKEYCTQLYPALEVWSYEDLAYAAFGVVGRILSLLTLATLLFLAIIGYMIFTRNQLAAVMQFIVMRTGLAECTPLLNCGVLMCIAFFPIFPITLLRNLSPLQFTSYLSIFSILLVGYLILSRTIITHASGSIEGDQHIQLGPINFQGVITVISYCGLTFICHFNLLPLQKEMTGNQTRAKLYFTIVGALVTAYLINNVVIFSAYFNFYSEITSDLMLNYENDDILITVARIFLFITILMSYPVLLHPTRANINGAIYLTYKMVSKFCSKRKQTVPVKETNTSIYAEFKVPTVVWFVETVALFSLTFIIATYINDVSKVWNFLGSMAGVLVLYVYPAAFYLRLRYILNRKRAQTSGIGMWAMYDGWDMLKEGVAWVIFGIGLVLLVVQNYQAIDAVVNTESAPSNGTNANIGFCHLVCKEINITNASS